MVKKSKGEEVALVLLAIGALLTGGRGLIPVVGPSGPAGAPGAPGAPGMNGSTTSDPSKPQTDPTSGRPNNENTEQPDTTGAATRDRPNVDPTGGMGSDKSKTLTGPGSSPSTADLINPLPPTGGTLLPNGNYFVPGLDIYGNSTGGPGALSGPSITTEYGGKTYTNFNPALFTTVDPTSKSQPPPVQQPAPTPQGAPVIAKSLPVAGASQYQSLIVDPGNLPDMSQIVTKGSTQQTSKEALVNITTSLEPAPIIAQPTPMIPNPLPQMPSFGQDFLNQLINAGQGLSGLFSNLGKTNLLGLPTIPGLVSPPPIPLDAV